MVDLSSLIGDVRSAWKALPLGPIERDLIKAAIVGLGFFCCVYAIERSYHLRTRYRSRMFAHDVAYWFYYGGGLHNFLVYAVFIAAIEKPLSLLDSALDLRILAGLPVILQIALFILINDFLGYWIHRAQHHYKFLWAFHTTHHSQEWLSFATTHRSHPLDGIIIPGLTYIPLRILGIAPDLGLLLLLLRQFVAAVSHSQIPWGWGFLYKIVVSPKFHAYHHSMDPMHHNRNLGVFFSFWDYLFGTSVSKNAPVPVRFGLENVKPTSLWSTLVAPFGLLREFYFSTARSRVPGSR